MQFLAESVMLTFVGGAIGVVVGWVAAFLMIEFHRHRDERFN